MVLVVLVAALGYLDLHLDWAGARHAVKALTPPAGFHRTSYTQTGSSNCSINPSCEPPIVVQDMASRTTQGPAEACAAMHRALPAWRSEGLHDVRSYSDLSVGECSITGQIAGHDVEVAVTDLGDLFITATPSTLLRW